MMDKAILGQFHLKARSPNTIVVIVVLEHPGAEAFIEWADAVLYASRDGDQA